MKFDEGLMKKLRDPLNLTLLLLMMDWLTSQLLMWLRIVYNGLMDVTFLGTFSSWFWCNYQSEETVSWILSFIIFLLQN